MRTYQNINPAKPAAANDLLRPITADEPVQYLDVHRKIRKPLRKCPAVLNTKNRRRHQYRNLLAVFHRLERRTHRKLRLAVTDVTAKQTVHRRLRNHIRLYLIRRRHLVARLLVKK